MVTLCPSLSKYHWYGSMDKFVELPGQYKGNAPPNPKTSLKIVKFSEDVSILKSLRNPIKINCICSDGKTYSFLIKYGEDLRQDERIQHVHELMSAQMHLNKCCSQQKLSLHSYRVIPLNANCGLISWIENTDTIQSFLESSNIGWNDASRNAWKIYEQFITGAKKINKATNEHYMRALIAYSRDEVSEKFLYLYFSFKKKKNLCFFFQFH